jgi:hypothetical protein
MLITLYKKFENGVYLRDLSFERMYKIQVFKITKECCLGAFVMETTVYKDAFVNTDYDVEAEASASIAEEGIDVSETFSAKPRDTDADDSSHTMTLGSATYQCRPAPCKVLQFGRLHDKNDVFIVDATFPRYAFRMCLYDNGVRLKAAGYGPTPSGVMEMKLTDKATVLCGGADFSTSNALTMLLGDVPSVTGEQLNNLCLISVKGQTYSSTSKLPRPQYQSKNLINAHNPIAGYTCGDLYFRIEQVPVPAV